ncbi:MAG: hypothetical protein H7A54_16895 [Akkermansiaceae bacterium]|nr:hypothetical protein [Akkermansiaceae bacterium]
MEAELARNDQIIAALQKRLFGSSSERIDPGQLQLDLDGVTLGAGAKRNRGRDGALDCATPPSEPDGRFSRIRLSSQRVTRLRRLAVSFFWASSRQKSPSSRK